MKIQGRRSSQVGALGPINIPAQPEPAAAKPEVTVTGDSVDLTSTQQLKKLREAVQSMPAVRAGKVEDLKGAIEEGSYYVESERLAKKVVDDVLAEALMKEQNQRKR